MNKKFALLLFLLGFSTVFAVEIFINGEKVTGITDQEIKNCSVAIDKDGNIFINAPDVKIVKDTDKLTKEYYASISFSTPLQNDFTLIVNGKIAGKVKKGEKESMLKLNSFLQKGENIISYTSLPNAEPIKFKLIAGFGEEKEKRMEFFPVTEHLGVINNLGAAGNFKFVTE